MDGDAQQIYLAVLSVTEAHTDGLVQKYNVCLHLGSVLIAFLSEHDAHVFVPSKRVRIRVVDASRIMFNLAWTC